MSRRREVAVALLYRAPGKVGGLSTWGRAVVWFFSLGAEERSCETRLASEGGYELIVVEGGRRQSERFDNLLRLLAREHEIVSAWRAQGWRQR